MWNRRMLNCALGAVFGLLLGAGGRDVSAQVSPPKIVRDTAKKPVTSDQRLKIGKEAKPSIKVQGAAGDVRLPPCAVDQDSVDRAIAAVRREQYDREQLARDAQRRL